LQGLRLLGDGTLSVIAEKDASTFVVAATISTGRTVAIDPKTGRLFLVAAGSPIPILRRHRAAARRLPSCQIR
jgi:hypothetical protein